MHIINEMRFVIETKAPKNAKNKTIQTDEGPTIVPDGETEYEYLWFAGVGAHPSLPGVVGAVWTPYPDQAAKYKDKDEANIVNQKILGAQAGGVVLSWDTCHKAEGRQIIVPVDAAQVKEAESLSGIKGKNI